MPQIDPGAVAEQDDPASDAAALARLKATLALLPWGPQGPSCPVEPPGVYPPHVIVPAEVYRRQHQDAARASFAVHISMLGQVVDLMGRATDPAIRAELSALGAAIIAKIQIH